MSVPIKNVILLLSKYSKVCDSLLDYIPDPLKETINPIYLDTSKTREIIKEKIKEVPSCVVVFTNNQTILYHGFVETKQFLDGLISVINTPKIRNQPENEVKNQRESSLPDVSSVQQLERSELMQNDPRGNQGDSQREQEKKESFDLYPEEVKKRRRLGSKLNVSEVLKQGSEIIEEGEKKTRRPQPRE
jgi:hypothetical protein